MLFLFGPNQTTDVIKRGAELLYGDKKRLSGIGALENSAHLMEAESSGGNRLSHNSGSIRTLTEEERMRLKDRYSMEYGRYLAIPCLPFGSCHFLFRLSTPFFGGRF